MTRAKDISKIVTDADLSGTLDVTGTVTAGNVSISDDNNYSFGDGTTYIQGSGAADRLKFITNASEAMRITYDGRVGIGTSSPDNNLHIHSDSITRLKITGSSGQGEDNGIKIFQNGVNTTIANGDNGYMRFYTNNTERMHITSAGNVGIGTSSPSTKLEVSGASNSIATFIKPQGALPDNNDNAGLYLLHQGTAGTGLRVRTDNALTGSNFAHILVNNASASINAFQVSQYGSGYIADFNKSGTSHMRIDTNGNVGIGTNNPYKSLTVGNSDATAYISAGGNNTNLSIASIGSSGSVIFKTGGTNGNAATTTEGMRITPAGAMTMGTSTSQTAVSGITLKNDVQGGYPTLLFLQNQPGTGGTMGADIHMGYASDYGSILRFYGNPFSTRPGGFQFRRVTGSGTSDLSMNIGTDGALNVQGVYDQTTSSGANVNVASDGHMRRSTSSLRYKNTVNDATHGLTELLTLRPVTYKGNNDGDTIFGGLIAEEVHDAGLTEFVTYNDDGEPDALAYGNMVSLCIKAIQELKAELDSAKARITALENGE